MEQEVQCGQALSKKGREDCDGTRGAVWTGLK